MIAALILTGMLASASTASVDGLTLAQQSCQASMGDADRLAAIAAGKGWRLLDPEDTEAMRDGNVPDKQFGYDLGGARLFLAVHSFGSICQITFNGDVEAVKASIEAWELGGARLASPSLYQPDVSNRVNHHWKNYMWPVNRAGIAAINLSHDPAGPSITLEMSYQ